MFHHTPPTTAQMRKEATPQMAPRRIVVALVRVRVRVRVRARRGRHVVEAGGVVERGLGGSVVGEGALQGGVERGR